MRTRHLSLGVVLLAVVIELRSALRHAAWGTTTLMAWITGVALIAGVVVMTVRTERRLPTAPLEESRRAVYLLALLALVLVSFALSLPGILPTK